MSDPASLVLFIALSTANVYLAIHNTLLAAQFIS